MQTWAEVHWRASPIEGIPIPLREAFARYIWNGGDRWREGWYFNWMAFVPFCFALVYNFIRAVLLWKTKALEQHEEITGLPADFRLEGKWLRLYQFAAIGFWLNFALVVLHTWHFMKLPVPVVR